MDIKTSKKELTKLIHDIDDPSLIERIRNLVIGQSGDFWDSLSKSEKRELELGIKQLNEGKGTSFEDFIEEIS